MTEPLPPRVAVYWSAASAHLPKERVPEAALAGVLAYIGRARRAISSHDVPGAHGALIAAQQIVGILRESLDRPAGGVLAANLDALYAYIADELRLANLEKDAGRLDALIPVITPLHTAWGAAAAAAARQAPVAAGGGSP